MDLKRTSYDAEYFEYDNIYNVEADERYHDDTDSSIWYN